MTISVLDATGASQTIMTADEVVSKLAEVIGEDVDAPAANTVNGRIKALDDRIVTLQATTDSMAADVASLLNDTSTAPVYEVGREYEAVAASATDQVAGATGATGDRLDYVVIQPATTSPGNVIVKDGSTTIYTFPGGALSVADLKPFVVAFVSNSRNGSWKISTGSNVSAVAFGDFT